MKLEVKYEPYNPWFGPKLLLNGKGELHVTETALIVEAERAKFSIPFTAGYYMHILSDWTTCTVPYGRIVHHRYSGAFGGFSLVKVLGILLVGTLVAAGLSMAVLGRTVESFVGGSFAVVAGSVLLVVVAMHGRRKHRVIWLDSNGKQLEIAFKIPGSSGATNLVFNRRLQEYLQVARDLQPAPRK